MKKITKQKIQKGFTVVELLIVIVIIGILAAIVINSFVGAQRRASNAATVSAANSWRKAISAYKEVKGLPAPTSGSSVCLSLDLPASNGIPAGRCTDKNETYTDDVFNTKIGEVSRVSSNPSYPAYIAAFGRVENKYRGIFYTTNGTSLGYVSYFVKGDAKDCGPGNASQTVSILNPGSPQGDTSGDVYFCMLPIN